MVPPALCCDEKLEYASQLEDQVRIRRHAQRKALQGTTASHRKPSFVCTGLYELYKQCGKHT